MFKKIRKFVTDVVKAAKNKIVWFFKGVYHHAEAITILTLAAFGLNVLVGELPFIFMLPMWIEAPLVIPTLAVVAVSLIVKLMEWRAIRRNNKLVLA